MGPIRQHLAGAGSSFPLAMVECRLATCWGIACGVPCFCFWLRYLVYADYRGTLLQVFSADVVERRVCNAVGACGSCVCVQEIGRIKAPAILRDLAGAFSSSCGGLGWWCS